MDIIDPTLESSVTREGIDEKAEKSLFLQILLLIAIAFAVWLGYSLFSSRLDTRPENQIDINPDLKTPSANDGGRKAPISETI